MYLMSDLWSSPKLGKRLSVGSVKCADSGESGPGMNSGPGATTQTCLQSWYPAGRAQISPAPGMSSEQKTMNFQPGLNMSLKFGEKNAQEKDRKGDIWTFVQLLSAHIITHNTIYFFYEIFVPGAGAGTFKLTAVTDTRSDGVSDAAEEMIFIFKF